MEYQLIIIITAGGPSSDYAFISFQRHRGNVTIIGIEALPCCKEPSKQFALVEEHITALRKNLYCTRSKVIIFVERNLVTFRTQTLPSALFSAILAIFILTRNIFCHNLRIGFFFKYLSFHLWQGFEAEHHARGLCHLENVSFYEDHKAGRVGVLTTNSVKHAAMELLNIMLRERRICVSKHVHSRDKKALLIRLRDQLEVYSHILTLLIKAMDVLICLLIPPGVFFPIQGRHHHIPK
jgi:hypothetical protein